MIRRRFHPIWLLVAAVALASWSGDATRLMKPPPEHEASTVSKSSTQGREGRKSQKRATAVSMTVTMVPIYPEGNLLLEIPKPKPKPKPRKQTKTKSKPRQGGKLAKPPSLPLDGERPSISISYESLGSKNYLTILAQRVGVMFALIADKKGNAVGPELDLLRGETKPRNEAILKRLQTKRPHVVDDPELRGRLEGLSLPVGAQSDRAVFYFFKWFDEVLWRTIASTLSRRDQKFKDIASIQARYMAGTGTKVYLELVSAVRKDGRKLKLGGKVWVTL